MGAKYKSYRTPHIRSEHGKSRINPADADAASFFNSAQHYPIPSRRKAVLNTITSGPADISMVAVKFAESVVLACVGGRGLAPGASRAGDKSVQRDLSPSHPFLLADTLDQAGHALARQMVGWLGSCGGGASGSPGGKGGAGWGLGFGAQHYTVLINALQNLATNRVALFADIVPVLATALESVNGGGRPDGRGSGSKTPAAPQGLQDAASSLRSACLRLLKVAPVASKSVQRLATAAALSGSDGEAKAAVDGNSALRGRINLPARPRERPTTNRAGTSCGCTFFLGHDLCGFVCMHLQRVQGLPMGRKLSVFSFVTSLLVLMEVLPKSNIKHQQEARLSTSIIRWSCKQTCRGVSTLEYVASVMRRLSVSPSLF